MDEQSRQDAIDKIERERQTAIKKLEAQRIRINERFDHKEAELGGKLNSKQEQIIDAALELLAEKGLNDLSVRDIAKKLDIKAPALYWYFKSKSELVDYMAEAMLSREFNGAKPRTENQAWQEWLAAYMGKLRKAMLAYPDGGRVVAGAHMYPAKTLAQIFDDCALSLTSAGIDQKTTTHTIMTAVHFTFGFVIEEQSSPRTEETRSFNQADFLADYPNFRNMVEETVHDAGLGERMHAAGIQLIIKGAEVV